MHPFLSDDFHVRWSQLTPEHIEPDIRHALEVAQKCLEKISSQDPATASYESTFGAFEDATELLSRGWGRLNHLDSVSDSPAQRAGLNAMLPEVTAFTTSIPLDPKLWAVLKTYGESDQAKSLDPVRHRFVQETMADFIQAGANLPPEKKEELMQVVARLSQLTKQFGEHVLDSTNAWELLIEEEERLAGLPASARAAALASARQKGHGSADKPVWRFTLHFPSMFPVMQYAEDDSLRREVWEASSQVGASGEYDNTNLVWDILRLRQRQAEILGHANFPDLTLERRMVKNGQAALAFVEDLHARVSPDFQRECRELQEYKAAHTGSAPAPLEPWETAYWAEKRRKKEYDLDDEDLRPYFPMNSVMSGMFEIVSKLYAIHIEERQTVFVEPGTTAPPGSIEVWHPEVRFFDLFDTASGDHLGSFYADWHPREPKRGGAWMNSLETGLPALNGEARKPHLGLICGNMSPPVEGQPALLTHREVETVFHEFGHLLHGLLSEVPVRSLAGTNVPWDFVELPSQIMENFCWDREALNLFARHHMTGEAIPEPLFQRMLAAKNYMSASGFMRQLAFGKLDLELHMHPNRYLDRNLDEVDTEILETYKTPLATEPPSMARRFSHLFSSPVGYAAGYYSYKWAEVLDADAFTRFKSEGVLSPTVGHEFRACILSKGNSEPVEELFHHFMGRAPRLEPLLVRSGINGSAVA